MPLRAVLAMAAVLAVVWGPAAWAAGDCPALPPRTPMPPEALPGMTEQASWRDAVAALDTKLPSMPLASRRLVFIGDSITSSWDPTLFGMFYGGRAPLLLGIGGDGTAGVLQRLPQEWGPLRPKLAVVLIGTNNIPYSPPENVALGIAEIVRAIHRRSADTRILIVGILPRGATAAEPLRKTALRVNEMVARCADGRTVFFTDISRDLIDFSGNLSNQVSYDFLHFTQVGYALIAASLEPDIRRIMGD